MQRLFGPVMQNAFIVDDLEAAIDRWVTQLGVGPFFVFEHIEFAEIHYRGKPTPLDLTAAMAYWGDVQIELILQHNDAPSIYADFKQRGLRGMQHMGVMTEDLDEHLARLKVLDIAPVQTAQVTNGARVAYVNTDFHPGTMIELIETGDAIQGFFKLMHDAAATWDGNAQIRRF